MGRGSGGVVVDHGQIKGRAGVLSFVSGVVRSNSVVEDMGAGGGRQVLLNPVQDYHRGK